MTPINSSSLCWLLLAALGAPLVACGNTDGPGSCTKGEKCGSGVGGTGETGGSGTGVGGTGNPNGGGGGGGAAVGTGGGQDGTGGASDGTGGGLFLSDDCQNPEPILPGIDSGIYRCDGGHVRRAESKECPSGLPRDNQVAWPDESGAAGGPSFTTSLDECETDSDCPVNDHCELTRTNADSCMGPGLIVPDYARLCERGCRTDADCESNEACICSDLIGSCRPIAANDGCQSDADCGVGSACLNNARLDPFSSSLFSCSRPEDECSTCLDDPSFFCSLGAEGKICVEPPVCGRPFLVEYAERLASCELSDSWLGTVSSVRPGLSTALRARLAEHWTRIGLMEHASIAAFARFTLELLALGAPASLLEASNAALVDETRHTRLAFGLASSYAGQPLGPGPLSLDGALKDAGRPEDLLRRTFREGCVGETRAALEVGRAAALCTDPDLRRTLESIAADEGRHAELAWRVVHFLVQQRPELTEVLRSEVDRVRREARVEEGPSGGMHRVATADHEEELAESYGLLGPESVARVHQEALQRVILPCVAALLGNASARCERLSVES